MFSSSTRRRLALLGLLAAAPYAAAAAQEEPVPGPKLFDAHCARCHGVGGAGGEGPSLNRPVLRHVADDAGLTAVIRGGIEGTEMPGTWMLSDSEVELVAAYVRSLGEIPPEALTGDASRGKAIYEGRGGCTVCHVVDGEGGVVGPALDGIGARRGAAYLKESILAPGAVVAADYVVARAVTADGREIVGARVNEDSFTVQIRDASGTFHSFEKRTLASFEKQFGESLMMSYEDELSPEAVDDVVAYLASLREDP